MLAALSRRLRSFTAKVETPTLMETPQRLDAYLLLADDEQNETIGGRSAASAIHLDISKSLLAGLLGTARETLSRCLARMGEQKILSVNDRTVRILDRASLENLARGTENL